MERAEAWDRHLATELQRAEEIRLAEDAGLWAQRATETRQQDWEAAQALRMEAARILAKQTGKGDLGDAARALDLASKLQRLCTDLPTDRAECTGGPTQNLGVIILPPNERD